MESLIDQTSGSAAPLSLSMERAALSSSRLRLGMMPLSVAYAGPAHPDTDYDQTLDTVLVAVVAGHDALTVAYASPAWSSIYSDQTLATPSHAKRKVGSTNYKQRH